jgi:hypothetical protein
MDTERPRERGLAQIAICACLALAGCASQPDRLPVEAGDVCGGQRAELAKFQGYYGTVIPGDRTGKLNGRRCHRHRGGHVPP